MPSAGSCTGVTRVQVRLIDQFDHERPESAEALPYRSFHLRGAAHAGNTLRNGLMVTRENTPVVV
jgi:hypothetical protein